MVKECMARRVLTLSGFIAFEAAARHNSLTRAAKELGRTQSAISQQIKTLEAQIGIQLFSRKPQKVILTKDGSELYQIVRKFIESINSKIDKIENKEKSNCVNVSSNYSFSTEFIIKRLSKFNSIYPEINVNIDATDEPIDLIREGIDLAIRLGQNDYSDYKHALLCRETFAPFYAPSLAPGRPLTGRDIITVPLLCGKDVSLWPSWCRANHISSTNLSLKNNYDHAGLLVQAAIAGNGIALAPLEIAYCHYQAGNLLIIPGAVVYGKYRYSILEEYSATKTAAQLFKRWLISEVNAIYKDKKLQQLIEF